MRWAMIFAFLSFAAFSTAAQTQSGISHDAVNGSQHAGIETAAAIPAAANVTPSQGATIDGIAIHIGNDVVTESEVRELEDYQKLLEGKAQSRAKILQELVDQWIVHNEAAAINFPKPNSEDVSREFQALLKHFASLKSFQSQLASVSLTKNELMRVLAHQIYYVRFLDYKFHAATQVTSAEIESYYQQQLAPQLQKKGSSVPPLSQVEAQIRQLLTQEQINEKAAQWLAEAKSRLRIVIQPYGRGG